MQSQYDPDLTPWEPISPDNVAGKDRVERPGHVVSLVWQTHATGPTVYENQLADLLQTASLGGAQTPADIVTVLNGRGPCNATGEEAWTEDSFLTEMRRLGA